MDPESAVPAAAIKADQAALAIGGDWGRWGRSGAEANGYVAWHHRVSAVVGAEWRMGISGIPESVRWCNGRMAVVGPKGAGGW